MMWTAERVEFLKKRWNEGHSASEIADALGGVTRNAVIGKVHRLGLMRRITIHRRSPSRRALPRGAIRRPRPAPALHGGSGVRKRSFALIAAPAIGLSIATSFAEELNMLPALRVNLLDLQKSMCRWPIGDPGDGKFHFCGHPKTDNSPYCLVHSRMAFRAADRRIT